jgi:hypothetical protein
MMNPDHPFFAKALQQNKVVTLYKNLRQFTAAMAATVGEDARQTANPAVVAHLVAGGKRVLVNRTPDCLHMYNYTVFDDQLPKIVGRE